jgi:tripartite-type tricarboxylate transporter receptor subunit TctC
MAEKLTLLRATCAFALLAAFGASAQDYPTRPVRVLVPYTPGGITDLVTRIAASELAKALNQSFVVDNRPGANSILAVELVSKASPDGYTLGTVIAAHAANQTLYAKLPYDSVKSFEHVSLLVTSPLIVCVTNSMPAKSINELIDLAKAKPGALSFASSGIGAAAHLTTELFMSTTGIKMTHVPYKGTAPALQDLIGGQINFMMDTPMPAMLPQARAGKVRAIGMASDKRISIAQDVPTLIEQGVQVTGGTWVAMLAPAHTPRAVVDKLSKAVGEAMRRSDNRERFAQLGMEPVGSTSPELTAFLKAEVAKWAKVIKDANVKID